jgi:hypothetical protein
MYKLLGDADENANKDMGGIYTTLDQIAEQLDCAIVAVHHASKGNQSGKAVTDVGSGAGTQSRSADTHLVLRQHEEPNVVVLEAAVRSFKPFDPVCIRWDFPIWNLADDLDPTQLKKENARRAASMARSMSSGPASATSPATSSVAGLMLPYVAPDAASTSFPSISIRGSAASSLIRRSSPFGTDRLCRPSPIVPEAPSG